MSDEIPGTDGAGTGPDGEQPTRVSRDAARAANKSRKNRKIAVIVGIIAVVVLGGVGLVFALGGGSEEKAATTTTEKETTTTAVPTTTTTAPVGPTAALTGVQLDINDAAGAALLNRTPLVAKIDNAPEAMPQIGLDLADVVFEIKVEGISRYMAVFQSKDVQEVGPIRSARTSDPDLLAMFGKPLLAWSGGNANVTEVIDSTPWVQSLNPSQAPDAYSRTSTKKAPHNLVLSVPAIYGYAEEPPTLPKPIFSYVAPGQDPGGVPVLGFQTSVGLSPLGYVWDPAAGTWLRFANDKRHLAVDGNQIAPTNVVVIETPYAASDADSRSPEAQTLGTGIALVYTQGRVTPGTWTRAAADQPYTLLNQAGQPMLLTPGQTFVELPDPGTALVTLDEPGAAMLNGL